MDNKDKAVGLFQYIKELYAIRSKVITHISDQLWVQYVNQIPTDEDNIIFNYLDRTTEEDAESEPATILKVTKPEFEICPEVPDILIDWMDGNWRSFKTEPKKIEKKPIDADAAQHTLFEDDESRVKAFESWHKQWSIWAINQRRIDVTRAFFNRLYHVYIDLERDEETLEFMVGQGVLHCTAGEKQDIHHPILLKRMKLEYNAQENILTIVDTTANAEIYTSLLEGIEYINHGAVKGLKSELSDCFYHPLDRNDTPDYLKSFAHRLHADGKYQQNPDIPPSLFDKITIYNHPVFFVRKRTSGVLQAIDGIIDQIAETGELSGPLLNLIGENVSQVVSSKEASDFSEQLSSICGEDKDILLSKEANKEQLEIARRIENYNAVLVQGPPGTGKTHTIANLMGHFLSQGKNILVTSHTKKALTVVKEKVVPELQDLCVAVLDDTNRDMERSVDGITEYISTHTSFELKETIEKTERKRNQILADVAKSRETLYAIKYKEYASIVFGGKGYSVAEAAQFVFEHQDSLSYLPGEISLYKPLPVTTADLELLYETNGKISIDEENELNLNLPDPKSLLLPQEFKQLVHTQEQQKRKLLSIVQEIGNGLEIEADTYALLLYGEPLCSAYHTDLMSDLLAVIKQAPLSTPEEWMTNAILAGKKGGGFRSVWDTLCSYIKDAYQYAGEITSLVIGKNVDVSSPFVHDKTMALLEEMKTHLSQGKKLSGMGFLFRKEWKELLATIKINGNEIASTDDIAVTMATMSLQQKRQSIQTLWDELISKCGGLAFSAFGEQPELSMISFVDQIENLLRWYHNDFERIKKSFLACGFHPKCMRSGMQFTYPNQEIEYLVDFVERVIPLYVEAVELTKNTLPTMEEKISHTISIIEGRQTQSATCEALLFSIKNQDSTTYEEYYHLLDELYQKYYYQTERSRILKDIAKYAPQWAMLIEKRVGIHGATTPPAQIEDAWKWKQFAGIIDEIAAQPFEELLHQSVRLNHELRKATAKLAECKAWYHLMLRIENDLSQKQALQGWKLTTKKIGKGTGKNAPKHKKEAQKLMVKCQTAVPAWIMPVNKALENLDPTKNKFDIVIIDEASQSDISALAIFYMARKIIVVGDDEQVSPSAVGVDLDKMNALLDMYLKDSIPNAHLYDMKSSLYDIAKTTFQPLMLKEHFRCVPDIIGYSNRLSYDYKIKPLRDDSDVTVKPATISYRVNGHRPAHSKTNQEEAENIVALMLSCMKQPEYQGMTFGAISLLGDEQAKLINNIAVERISPNEYEKRHILCGNASHFQGDERDVIFISLVDSNEGEGPLRMAAEGNGKSTKQRYNVAASRAKNQLWVVHSLDSANDLKSGDLRKDLIEYAMNPADFAQQQAKIIAKSDSPFEVSVASHLVKEGYHIVQQWPVGSFRIDMVAVCGDKRIAIECDGELYHSGEDKVREDMERQAILERLGWTFIRIRGSEYYRNPENAMKRVISELTIAEIMPENAMELTKSDETELQQRVVSVAATILDSWKEEESEDEEYKFEPFTQYVIR
ncbi:MAG: AAA domain-containing protein [Christensenellaceae bacterium]